MADRRIVSGCIMTPFGPIGIGATQKGVCAITFLPPYSIETLPQGRYPDKYSVVALDHVHQAEQELKEYFTGIRKIFTFKTDHINTDFRKKVLAVVSEIPYGETRSYGQIAEAIGCPGASRAVGSVNATNPLPIVIPCHRVVRSDGGLGGYGGGLLMKQDLLSLELSNSCVLSAL